MYLYAIDFLTPARVRKGSNCNTRKDTSTRELQNLAQVTPGNALGICCNL